MSAPMRETDIRPADLFRRFLDLSREDIATFFSDPSCFHPVPCPGCGAEMIAESFVKLEFRYVLCAGCGSLYVSPRPILDFYRRYYAGSAANQFLANHFYRESAPVRRERIYRPRAAFVAELVSRDPSLRNLFVDVGSGAGIFLDEIQATGCFNEVAGIEPVEEAAAQSRARGLRIFHEALEDVQPDELSPTVMTAFEVLEHVLDPHAFLMAINRVLRPNGLCILTTLTISGFDLQVLWKDSKSIYPPHHINFLSLEGIHALAQRCGFAMVDLSTPGQLDVDIVRNALLEDPSLPVPRFVSYLLRNRDESVLGAFQNFLQVSGLSSHMRCVLRKLPQTQ